MRDQTIQFFERLNTHAARWMIPDWQPSLANDALAETKLPDGFEIGRNLRATVDEIIASGAKLLRFVGSPVSDQIGALIGQLEQTTTRVAVVGQIKAGKSSFINALTGRDGFLPTHVNPWTAVPTKLYFGVTGQPYKGALFEFFRQDEWNRLGNTVTGAVVGREAWGDQAAGATARVVWRRALLRIGEHYHHLLGERHRYDTISPKVLSHYLCVGAPVDHPSTSVQAGRYADITRLAHVYLPRRPFATPTILIDTPGLNDPTFIRVSTTQSILEYADAYVVILTASQPLSLSDIILLRQLRGLEKRRFLVFINRVDELSGGRSDIETVENYVRARLRREFPGAFIPVISGSALWANAANDGGPERLKDIAASPAFRAVAGSAALADAGNNIDALRALIFETSGLPGLGLALSEMMLGSFLASEGSAGLNLLMSAAEVTTSAARLELKTLRELNNQARPASTSGGEVHIGIAQIEKRLRGLTQASEAIATLISASRDRIEAICATQCASIGGAVDSTIETFLAREKKQLRAQSDNRKKALRSFDTTALLKQLESDFLERFSAAITEISAVHDECLAQVRGLLETPHAEAEITFAARRQVSPDIRRALPALAASIDIDTNIRQPWWRRLWSASKTPEDGEHAFDVQIRGVLTPVAERLVALAEHELGVLGEDARKSIEAAASSAINATSARLHDLGQRLLQYEKQESSRRLEMVSKDYARGIKALLHVIAQCEAIAARLRAISAGVGRDV